MSRSTVSKSRADKSKDKDKERGGSTSAPAPPANSDVIPGRFTENDWNGLVKKEDGEEFIFEIVAEVVDSAVDVIFKAYIQKQLYPYVVEKSRELFLHIIEWQFLTRDEGEENPVKDVTWSEEEEPLPSVPDAWAQGSVPHHPLPPVSPALSEHDTELTSVSRISNPEILDDLASTVAETATIDEDETELAETDRSLKEMEGEMRRNEEEAGLEKEEEEEENNNVKEAIEVKQEPPKRRKPKYKPYRGPLKSAGVRFIDKPLDETEKELMEAEVRATKGADSQEKKSALDNMPSSCHNILKVQTGRPPGSKEVTYDDMGNVVAVVKLDPEKLPSHRVRTKFTVIDPEVEAAQARLQAMRTGRSYKNNETGKYTPGRSTQQKGSAGMRAMSVRMNMTSGVTLQSRYGQSKDDGDGVITPLPPPLIDSMELSPGVIVREGSRFKQGPKPTLRNGEVAAGKVRSLRPLLTMDNRSVPISMGDIIGSHSPSVRPLMVNEPIPPIVPRHAQSRENTVES